MGAGLSCGHVADIESAQAGCLQRRCWSTANGGDLDDVMADVDTTDAPIVPASGSQHKAEQAGAFLPPDGQTPESIAHAWSLQAQNAAETTDHPGGLDVDMDVDLGPEMRKMDTATCVAETEWSQFPSMSAAVQSEVDPQSEGPSDAGSVCSGASSCSSANHFRGNKRRPAKRLLVTHTMGLQPSSALQLIIESGDDIHTHYDLDRKLLGEGSFGVVRKGTLKATGAVRAVKAISKKKMKTMNAIIKLEIQIMKHLDHPNLLMLYEVLEDAKNLYLVLEMCTGGSLQDHITRSGSLPEKTTAGLIQQILRAVVYLHKHQIVHRDMKAENCLIDKAGPLDDATLKVADFGLSCKIEPGKALVKIVGTPTHMAPEVIAKKYTQICDVWSCGVILYVMLSGHLPFRGSTREEIQKNITQGAVEFKDKEWLDVSQAAVDFVLSLLKKHPKKRFTAVQALSFAWIKDCVPPAAKAKLQWRVIEDLRKFRRRNRFKRAALHVMASMLTEDDVKENRKAFIALDRDGDGFFHDRGVGREPQS